VIDDVSAGPGNSVDDMVEFPSRALERVVLIQHAISTANIEIDGDSASARRDLNRSLHHPGRVASCRLVPSAVERRP
jgi:hypothetical protein